MRLTSEFIELQGFTKQETISPHKTIFHKPLSPSYHTQMLWNSKSNYITITLHIINDDNTCISNIIFKKKIKSILDLTEPLHTLYKNTNHECSIILPDDLYEQFIQSNYPYKRKEFELMTDIIISILLQKEQYENCITLIEYRKMYYKEKKWSYKEINPDRLHPTKIK